MYWYYWYFYCEGDEEVEYQQLFYVGVQLGFQQGGVVEGDYVGGVEVDEYQVEDCYQYYQVVGLGEDEEFGGGVDVGFFVVIGVVFLQCDEEVYWYQYYFLEEEEQEQVDGEEYVDYIVQDLQQVQVEEVDVVLDFVLGVED